MTDGDGQRPGRVFTPLGPLPLPLVPWNGSGLGPNPLPVGDGSDAGVHPVLCWRWYHGVGHRTTIGQGCTMIGVGVVADFVWRRGLVWSKSKVFKGRGMLYGQPLKDPWHTQ